MNTTKFTVSTPEEAGIPSSAILTLLDDLEDHGIPMHSLIIQRKGRLACEAYWAPYTQKSLQRMYSITKTFVSLAIGILISEGRLSLNDRIIDYFPDKLPPIIPEELNNTTIEHLLMMTTCHRKTTYKIEQTDDWVGSFFTVPPDHAPGAFFMYDTSGTHVLGALVERVSQKPLLEFLQSKVLSDLGFSSDAYILKDKHGIPMGGSGLMATSRDILAVLSYFNAKEGPYASYLASASTKKIETGYSGFGNLPVLGNGYGYYVWMLPDKGFFFYGMGGQLAISFPASHTLIVTTAYTKAVEGGLQTLFDALITLVGTFQDKTLETTKETRILTRRLAGLELFHLNNAQPKIFSQKPEGEFVFATNSLHLESAEIWYEEEQVHINLGYPDNTYSLTAGIGKNIVQPWPPDKDVKAAISASVDFRGMLTCMIQLLGPELGILTIMAKQTSEGISIGCTQYNEKDYQGFTGIANGKSSPKTPILEVQS